MSVCACVRACVRAKKNKINKNSHTVHLNRTLQNPARVVGPPGDPKGDQRKERKAKPSTDQTPPTGPLTFTNPKDIQTPTNQGNLKGPKEKLRKDAGVVDLACMKISTKEGSRRPPPGQSKRNTSGPPRPRPRQRTTPGPRRGHRPESKPRSRSAPHLNAARAPNPTQQDGALQAHQAPHRPTTPAPPGPRATDRAGRGSS
ncbi:uncharacterized protein LOC144034168 [Vanacampus margaritifer]